MLKFGQAFRGELIKLISRKKYIFFLIIGTLICAVVMLVQLLMERFTHGSLMAGFFGTTFGLLGFFIRFYIPLICFMGVCDLFSCEAQDGSIRAALLRPVSRWKLYLAKGTAAYVLAVFYLAALFLAAALLELFSGGAVRTALTGLASYALDAVPLMVVVLMAAFLCQLFQSPTLAMLMCIVVYFGLSLLGTFVPRMGGMLFTSFSTWHNLWIGSTLPFFALLPKMALLAGYGAVFLLGGYLIFDQRDY